MHIRSHILGFNIICFLTKTKVEFWNLQDVLSYNHFYIKRSREFWFLSSWPLLSKGSTTQDKSHPIKTFYFLVSMLSLYTTSMTCQKHKPSILQNVLTQNNVDNQGWLGQIIILPWKRHDLSLDTLSHHAQLRWCKMWDGVPRWSSPIST